MQIQSANSSVSHLVERTDAFVAKFGDHLAALSDDTFSSKAVVLAARLLESDKTPGDQARRMWGPILSGTFDFHTSEAIAAVVVRLNKADILSFFSSCIASKGSFLRQIYAGVYSVNVSLGHTVSACHGGGPTAVPDKEPDGLSPSRLSGSWLVPPLQELAKSGVYAHEKSAT